MNTTHMTTSNSKVFVQILTYSRTQSGFFMNIIDKQNIELSKYMLQNVVGWARIQNPCGKLIPQISALFSLMAC